MNHGGRKAVAYQFLRQPFGGALGARKDQRLTRFCVEQFTENVQFLSRPHFVGAELHAFGGLQHGADDVAAFESIPDKPSYL